MENKQIIRAAGISLIVSVLLLGAKLSAYFLTHSTAVLSDALESIVNVLAAIVALFVTKIVAEPADEEHPYGHGKLEYFSASFEGGLIAFAAIMIMVESVSAFFRGVSIKQMDVGAILMAATAVVNLILAVYLRRVAKQYKSETLLASSMHIFSDVWTTVAVIAGLLIVQLTGWVWLDSVTAFLVAFQLGLSGVKIVRRSAGALIDEREDDVLIGLAQAIEKTRSPGLIDVHQLRVIRSGRFHHVDAHLVVPEFWNVAQTHEAMIAFEKKIVAAYPHDGEIAFHIDPCERRYCEFCDLADCSIRQKPFTALKPITMKSLILGPGEHRD